MVPILILCLVYGSPTILSSSEGDGEYSITTGPVDTYKPQSKCKDSTQTNMAKEYAKNNSIGNLDKYFDYFCRRNMRLCMCENKDLSRVLVLCETQMLKYLSANSEEFSNACWLKSGNLNRILEKIKLVDQCTAGISYIAANFTWNG